MSIPKLIGCNGSISATEFFGDTRDLKNCCFVIEHSSSDIFYMNCTSIVQPADCWYWFTVYLASQCDTLTNLNKHVHGIKLTSLRCSQPHLGVSSQMLAS